MAFCRLARPALSASASSISHITAAGAAARTIRVSDVCPSFRLQSLSTTAFCQAPPRSQPRAGSWPPQRSQDAASPSSPSSPTPSSPTPAASHPAASPLSHDPLKDIYASNSPARWAAWSSDDFEQRHSLNPASALSAPGGVSLKPGESARLTSNSSRTHPGGGTRITLGPITGRTVHVGGTVDPANAFLMLNIMIKRNKVAADAQRQRFHERPGKKRKRLASERWQRKFRRGFIATVNRAKELARQGW
ncbi:hypothetical protein SEPCBS119000_002848 [Sporothrix epigloea]|uniref:Ribosomal protein s21 n=1 Tax=Sporothrix epigloea TaxID=1892477 RepID=A0ABP0DL61_9PEZI